jgi:hypothetical protein
MTQEIIVILIIALAVAYVGFKIYRKMNPNASDDGCDSGCGGCDTPDCALRKAKKK